MDQKAHNFTGHWGGYLPGTAIIPGAGAATQRARVADFNGEARTPHPQMQVVRHPLRLHLIRQVPNAKRKYIRPSEDGIDLKVAAIETTGPPPVGVVEVKPVIPAVDGYVVKHENQWSVISDR